MKMIKKAIRKIGHVYAKSMRINAENILKTGNSTW